MPSSAELIQKRFANPGFEITVPLDGFIPEPLEHEVRRIYQRSPLYGKRFALHTEPLRWACYQEIPVLTKREITDSGHCAFFTDCQEVDRQVLAKQLESETTSGSTAAPMTVIMEAGWWDEQTRRAYRAHPLLASLAERPYRKAILAPVNCSSNLCPYEDFPFPNRYFDGTAYLNLSSDPFCFTEVEWDRIVVELQAVKPEALEGEPVYLSLLARAVLKRGVTVPSLRVVILTYGKASEVHGRRIHEAFPVPQVDLYGSTEAGYLFVGDAFAGNSRVIDENAFIELVPWDGGGAGVSQILVTTRNREAMPLLRYHTGDIVESTANGFRLLGRERDLYRRSDKKVISAADIDRAFPPEFSCWHYCLTQVSETRWNLDYVANERVPVAVPEAIATILGPDVRVNAFRRRLIAPAASGKFALLKPLPRAESPAKA